MAPVPAVVLALELRHQSDVLASQTRPHCHTHRPAVPVVPAITIVVLAVVAAVDIEPAVSAIAPTAVIATTGVPPVPVRPMRRHHHRAPGTAAVRSGTVRRARSDNDGVAAAVATLARAVRDLPGDRHGCQCGDGRDQCKRSSSHDASLAARGRIDHQARAVPDSQSVGKSLKENHLRPGPDNWLEHV